VIKTTSLFSVFELDVVDEVSEEEVCSTEELEVLVEESDVVFPEHAAKTTTDKRAILDVIIFFIMFSFLLRIKFIL